MMNKKYIQIITMLSLIGGVSCSHFNRPTFVEFDEASAACKESRELIAIESKMIPSDSTLNNEAKNRTGTGTVVEADPVAQTNSKLLDEDQDERFVTIPKERFASVTLPNGKRLVYWIHFVSSDIPTLDKVENEVSSHYKKINKVLLKFHQSKKLKTPGWEDELNNAILQEIKSISKFKKITKVHIHLGC